MQANLYPENLQVSINTFIQKMYRLNRADNPELVAKLITKWTQGQTLLTKKLLQHVLQAEGRINEGEEGIAVEKVIRNSLLHEFKQDELTLFIREALYKKDLSNLLEINHNKLEDNDWIYLTKIQRSLGLTDRQVQVINDQLGIDHYLPVKIDTNNHNFHPVLNKSQAQTANLVPLRSTMVSQSSDLVNPSFENSNLEDKTAKKANKKWWLLLLLLPGLFVGFQGLKWYEARVRKSNNLRSEQQKLCVDLSSRKSPRMSLGEKLLTQKHTQLNPDSTIASYQGMVAFARCEFSLARDKYQASLAIDKNNPEALIYYNNAEAIADKHFKIAVSVPLGNKPDIAWEILRGVAQAQTEINQHWGIKNKKLLVQIVNDDNNPRVVRQVAKKLAADPKIVAVVGHNDSNSSLAGAKIYQREKLVMISPTSTSTKLSGIGSHIMRTIPSVSALANKLANYASINSYDNIAICFDSQDSASDSFAEEFIDRTIENSGQIAEIDCDFALNDFQPRSIVSEAIAENADALLLVPSVNKMSQAIAIAQANQQQLPLLGNHSLYTYQTIESGKDAIAGMVIPSPWLAEDSDSNNFPQAAVEYWGGQVNWRTAMAYDATGAIIQGLQQSKNRTELQSVLTKANFSVDGATGTFHFKQGDRMGQIQLAYIKKSPDNSQYQFSKLKL